jgi:hypothetical protein
MNAKRISILAVAVVCALGLTSNSFGQTVIFGPDTTMSTGNWTFGTNSTSTNATINSTSLTDVNPGGNPALQAGMNVTFTSTNSKFAAITVFRDDWTHNPSLSGNLTSFSFGGNFTAVDHNVAIRLALKQGTNTFWTTGNSTTVFVADGKTYVSFSNIVSSDFSAFGGSSGTVDFSDAGGAITFGWAVRYGQSAAFTNRAVRTYADDVEYTLGVIPEPATAALLGVSLAALALLRRRRQ